jgi:hypothetical protein
MAVDRAGKQFWIMGQIRKWLLGGASLAVACALLPGCGNRTAKLAPSDREVFKDAAPELKQSWESGLTADKVNDYLTAGTNFLSLLGQNLTVEQIHAVQTAMVSLNERMYAAAAKGDDSAQKAIEALKTSHQRRP